MNQRNFEERVLHLWMTTRVPMTKANLLFYTKAPRKKLDGWLDELVGDGILDVDADGDGEMTWGVRGAQRAARGPTSIDEVHSEAPSGGDLADKLARLRKEAVGSGASMVLASRGRDGMRELMRAPREGEKSLLASGLLGLFFGPFGLLYAAPFKVAVPASVIMIALSYLFGWHVFAFSFVFAALSTAYAWRYNQKGERTPLLGDSGDDGPPRALTRRR